MDSKHDELRRALALTSRVDESVAAELREWRLGTALITPELPKVWDASYFRVEEAGDGDGARVGAETVGIAADAGLAHAAVVITHEEIASRLGPGLTGEGFEETRFVLMALRDVPAASRIPIEDASFEEVATSRRELTLEIFRGDEELADQLGELDRRLKATIAGRWFAVKEDGNVVSRAWLFGADGVGQVEDVATLSSYRGRGLARAAVGAAARASREAGNELTFVIADDGETTPELYRKTGFEPIGFKRRFVKKLT